MRLDATLLLQRATTRTLGAMSDMEQHLIDRSIAWMSAWKASDREALEEIMAPDFALIVSSAPTQPLPRDKWLALAQAGYVCESFQYKDQVVRFFGDTAVVSSIMEQRASVHGHDRSGEFFLTDIWRLEGGSWRVCARYSSKAEVPSGSSKQVAS